MNLSNVLVLDFETHAIKPRPGYPPEPVGVALRWKGTSSYLAWGHPSGNNCSKEDTRETLRRFWEDDSITVLCHNAAFDLTVAADRLGLPMLPWRRFHDTMFLLFLHDPHAKALGLKPASEALLDWPAEERDAVHEWIYDNRKEILAQYGEPGQKITRAKTGDNSPAAWIAYAPGGLVGRYAVGDVDRTEGLFRYLYPRILSAGMGDAYDRERRLMPILLENERRGLRVDLEGLARDVPRFEEALESVEAQMRAYLGASGLSFDKDRDVADVFQSRGIVREDAWVKTESGQLSVSKDNLPPDAFTDPLFAAAFGYRNRLVTCLKMFMQPWAEQASANRGFIHTQWNQVRGSRGGARTGRPSMTKPNLLNVSKPFEGRDDGYVHPEGLGLPNLPEVRTYVLADEEEEFIHRDFDGQELRIFAHFECGDLQKAYLENADLDPHGWVGAEIEKMTGKKLGRSPVKIMNFQSLYGGGIPAIAGELRCSHAEAKEFKAFHDGALPGRKILSQEIQRIVRRNEPIRTWGGRLYYVEPPSYSKKSKRIQTWEYKLINYLVQGSAADVTKEAICRWHEGGAASNGARFLLTVYDEINITADRRFADEHMVFLKEIMNGIELDVPMRSSGKRGERWGRLEKCE